ncbi:MAG TPA: VirB4 family type IV secretion/conjugal transfer ATPase, partial [Burkholderiaceae bacterium]|nr:VirB4 family type IV secretion/conjugal transfer ATPase [Burkholderiaceae bacterium]
MHRPRYWSAAQREAALCAFIPWSSLVDACTVATRGGDYLRAWRLAGIPFETAGENYILDCHESACNTLRSLSGGHFAVYSHLVRRRVTVSLPSPREPAFAVELDARYQASLTAKPMMATELYLTLLYRPFVAKSARAFSKARKTSDEIREAQQVALAELDEKGAILAGGLRAFGPRLLARYEREGRRYSELLEFLRFLVTGAWQRVPEFAGPIYRSMAGVRLFFGGANVEVREATSSRFGQLLDILEYPSEVQPGTLDCLLYQDAEFVQTQ